MQVPRRRFLNRALAGLAGAGTLGAAWLGTSKGPAGRLTRLLLADAQRDITPAPFTPDPTRWSDNALTICWLGHATTLINFYGVHILTDPVFSRRVGVGLGFGTIGPKRFVAPALTPSALPPIDLVLLSHAHLDHMDLASLRQLGGVPHTITAKATSDVLAGTGLERPGELRWGEQTTLRTARGTVQIEAFEVKHWGQRWPRGIQRGYNGYILRREGRSLLFGGDTAQTSLFTGLLARGPFAAAIMPIGAYQPWIRSHCTPEQALSMANAAGATHIVPIHHQTFRLSDEPMREPIERLQEALQREPVRLGLREIGETFVCPPV